MFEDTKPVNIKLGEYWEKMVQDGKLIKNQLEMEYAPDERSNELAKYDLMRQVITEPGSKVAAMDEANKLLETQYGQPPLKDEEVVEYAKKMGKEYIPYELAKAGEEAKGGTKVLQEFKEELFQQKMAPKQEEFKRKIGKEYYIDVITPRLEINEEVRKGREAAASGDLVGARESKARAELLEKELDESIKYFQERYPTFFKSSFKKELDAADVVTTPEQLAEQKYLRGIRKRLSPRERSEAITKEEVERAGRAVSESKALEEYRGRGYR
jgi:hypothetical protein